MDRRRIGAYVVALIGVAIALSSPWWRVEVGPLAVAIYLHQAQACVLGHCESFPLGGESWFETIALITFVVAIGTALLLIAAIVTAARGSAVLARRVVEASAL